MTPKKVVERGGATLGEVVCANYGCDGREAALAGLGVCVEQNRLFGAEVVVLGLAARLNRI